MKSLFKKINPAARYHELLAFADEYNNSVYVQMQRNRQASKFYFHVTLFMILLNLGVLTITFI